VNAVVGTWVSESAVVNAVRVSDLKFVAVRRSLNESKSFARKKVLRFDLDNKSWWRRRSREEIGKAHVATRWPTMGYLGPRWPSFVFIGPHWLTALVS
jgi:hypothetical protein